MRDKYYFVSSFAKTTPHNRKEIQPIMRETKFIEQNKKKWKEFEQFLTGLYKDPDKLSKLFIQITDDLSFARTFYPNRSVRVYLNGLAQQVFFSLYKSKRSPFKRIANFWLEELPQLVYEARGEFRLSFFIFLASFLVGVFSSIHDPDFALTILGEDYIEMTKANIESGDPMAVYKQKGQFGMSLGITGNNLYVAFLTFILGVFFGIGSIAILIQNGVMVGTFQYFFIERDLFWESFLTIWIHGTLEISAIIIAGAAGLTIGRGLAFPGTYTRLQSFQRAARRGIKIMIGIAPIIILAGFIEGFLTRYTETPNVVRGLFILVCLGFVLVYFVWYPRFKASVGFKNKIRDTKIPPDRDIKTSFQSIKTTGDIITDMFSFFNKRSSAIVLMSALFAAFYTAIVYFLREVSMEELFIFPWDYFGILRELDQFFINRNLPPGLLFGINTLTYGLLIFWLNNLLLANAQAGITRSWVQWFGALLKVLMGSALIHLILLTNSWFTFWLFLLIVPFILVWTFVMQRERANPILGLQRILVLVPPNYGRTLGLFSALITIGFLFFALLDSVVLWFFLGLISWVVKLDAASMQVLSSILLIFTTAFMMYLIFSMIVIALGFLYYTLFEITSATNLKERILQIGKAQKIRGLAKE